jgi:hypothetical protein
VKKPKEGEPRDDAIMVSLYGLGELLKKATEIGLLKWEPTGEKWELALIGKAYRGYQTKIDYKRCFSRVLTFTVKTVIRRLAKKSFFGTKDVIVYGLEIEGDEKKIVFSSHPELFPGKKADKDELFKIISKIQRVVEDRDPIRTVKDDLISEFYTAMRL